MSSTQRRVVVTALGAISPIGSTREELWNALSTGTSGIGPLTVLPPETVDMHCAGEAKNFSGKIGDFGPLQPAQKKLIRKALKVMCRECQMGVAAAQLALSDAALDLEKIEPLRSGIEFGADYMLSVPEEFNEGVLQCLDESGNFEFSRWAKEGLPKLTPLWLLKYLPNMPASHLAIFNDFRGPNNSLTLREASANLAVGEAYQVILRGDADMMLVGSTGTRLHPMKLIHATQQEELATCDGDPATASRPFDKNRTGMVLGEGAAAIVLEELSAAEARGANILGEVVGSSSSAVAGRHLSAQRDQAMINALRAVLQSSGIEPDELGHLNAHGLSTRQGDVEEARAIHEVFGSRSEPLPIVAPKSYFGNMGAGSGMLELATSLLALDAGQLFPVLNYETPDPECPLAVVTGHDTPAGETFVNLSVTPQGQASAVAVRKVG